MARGNEVSPGYLIKFLTEQFEELEKVHKDPYEDFRVLHAKAHLAIVLADQIARAAGWQETRPGPKGQPERVSLEQWLVQTKAKDPLRAKVPGEWYGRAIEFSEQANAIDRKWPRG
jgi:hypothetical protein